MKIQVFGKHDRESTIVLEESVETLDIKPGDFTFGNRVHVVCRVRQDGDFARVQGEVTVPASLECARCLEQYSQDIIGTFSLVARRLRKGESIPAEPEDEEVEDDLIFVEFDEDSIDITDFIHDALLLAVPLKSICRESCRGLCPICGSNLNNGDCGCSKKNVDPRWQSLTELKPDKSRSGT